MGWRTLLALLLLAIASQALSAGGAQQHRAGAVASLSPSLHQRLRRLEDKGRSLLVKDHRQKLSISAQNFRELSGDEDGPAAVSYSPILNQSKKYVGANSLPPRLGDPQSSLINSEEISRQPGVPLLSNASYNSPDKFQLKSNGEKRSGSVDGHSIERTQTQNSARQGFDSAADRNKGNVKSQGPSASRTRWKKQNKNKHGGGGHWIEYDFDEGTSTTTADPLLPENPVGLKNPNLLVGPWVEEPTVRKSKANFGGTNNTLVNAQIGTTAKLPCLIFNRDDHETVSWIRRRDHHLITVGRQTYSSDNRFSVNFNRHLSQWTLHLRYVQPRDAGEYICQLSTDPVMVYLVRLSVTEATSVIKGGGERYVHEGSSVRLECGLQNHTQPPDYVFWYHNGTMINYDLNRKVKVEATADGSVLTLLSVGRTDSGNYTCAPANAQLASIMLHIILGDTLAAMKVSGAAQAAGAMPVLALLQLLVAATHARPS